MNYSKARFAIGTAMDRHLEEGEERVYDELAKVIEHLDWAEQAERCGQHDLAAQHNYAALSELSSVVSGMSKEDLNEAWLTFLEAGLKKPAA